MAQDKTTGTRNALVEPDAGTRRPVSVGFGLVSLGLIAYVWLGLPSGLLGVAWPSMRHDFGLSLDAIGALFLATNVGYLPCSFFAGRLAARFHLGALLAASTFLAGSALLTYSLSPNWWVVVAAGVVAGVGGGGIDAALNIYVAANHGERAMQWLHACYGVGAMLGPVFMTLAISSLGTWRWGYAMVGAVELGLAAGFLVTVSRWNGRLGAHAQGSVGSPAHATMLETLREWRVWLSVLLFLIYMGIEVTLGSWSYTLLTEGRGVSPCAAGFFMSGYWGIFTLGRLAAGVYTRRFTLRNIVVAGLGIGALGAVVLVLDVPGPLNLVACALIGLAISPVFAALLSETPSRVGERHMANTIGIQLAATGVGAAVLPSLAGVVAERISLQAIPVYLLAAVVLLIGLYLFSHAWCARNVAGSGVAGALTAVMSDEDEP